MKTKLGKKVNKLFIGIDEAGRGPWAGPVFVGSVILDQNKKNLLNHFGVTDSKKLTSKKREIFYSLIKKNALYTKVIKEDVRMIDKIGIYKATVNLIDRLIQTILKITNKYGSHELELTVDGVFPSLKIKYANINFIPKADELFVEVGAASVLAKVERDQYMIELDHLFPQYQFGKHKGYGTQTHQRALLKYGACKEHRNSFKPIKKIIKILHDQN